MQLILRSMENFARMEKMFYKIIFYTTKFHSFASFREIELQQQQHFVIHSHISDTFDDPFFQSGVPGVNALWLGENSIVFHIITATIIRFLWHRFKLFPILIRTLTCQNDLK